MNMKKSVSFLSCLLIFLTYSCKEDSEKNIPLRAIEVASEKIELAMGETQYLKAEPVPSDADADEMPFEWKSSHEAVATVSPSGMVRAISAGTVQITVSGRISTGVHKTIAVTVVDTSIPLTGITVNPEELSLEMGKSAQITATPVPANATAVTFSWESNDKDIATVGINGLVTAKAVGKTTVTVKSGNIEKEIPVSVTTPPFKIVIGNTTYAVDTLAYEVISKGIHLFKFSLPEFTNGFGSFGKGLSVSAVEVDLSYPENELEVWTAMINADNSNRERPVNAFKYETTVMGTSGRKPVAMTNGDFYVLDANLPEVLNKNTEGNYGAYQRRRPHGMEVKHGKIIETPFTDIIPTVHNKALLIRDNRLPDFANSISFSGSVKIGSATMTLSNINSFVRDVVNPSMPRKHPAKPGELVLFNNEAFSFLDYREDQTQALDSALAWSPYPSTMVSLSYPKDGWKVNEAMKFTVTAIEYDVETRLAGAGAGSTLPDYGGKRFNGEGAILVGNPTTPGLNDGAKQFLSTLQVGDEIEITTEVKVNGNTAGDKKLSAIGIHTERPMLQNGTVSETWGEAHPRTVIGYSQDRKKAYLLVIDGRQTNYSAGVTTGQAAAILKALGAYTGLNLDGGGSSIMVVNGNTVNTPSESPQRVVANGLMITTENK